MDSIGYDQLWMLKAQLDHLEPVAEMKMAGLTKECPGATTSNCGWDSFACAEFDLTGGGETLVFTDRSQSTPVKNESTSTIKLLITRY